MKINYLKIARETVEDFIKDKVVKDFPEFPTKEKAGVFVSIYKKKSPKKELRGCIGTYLPTKSNIIQEVISNAIAAATNDLRFPPIASEELSELSYSVDVLEKPEPIKNAEELDPKKYGVIIKTRDGKCGLLLPNIEGVNHINQQLSIACQKAGIDPKEEKNSIYRFTVKRYKE